ncbi:MAG: RNA 2',3'-cyclic phosphodiesterase [Archangium sp.]|nr:RNA 2',3'-cyclic phosphodiesterase [Archangium sp.]
MSFFIAADLDARVRAQVVGWMDPLQQRLPAKWLRPDKLHLTLVFLGHPPADRLEALRAHMAAVATRHAPFQLHLAGSGRFVTARAPDVLWLGVGGALEPLHALAADLARAAELDPERTYRPHVTLARGQSTDALKGAEQALQRSVTEPFVVDHLTLYESANDRYRAVTSTPLRAR